MAAPLPLVDLGAMHAEVRVELDRAWHALSRSGKFIGGESTERFEAEWARHCGAAHCVGVASGTAALELSLAALGIGEGDEVIVPANSFIATAAAVATVGARPVFIDVDPATLLMTAAGVEAALTPRTAAVIVVHLFGQPVDMDAIGRVAAAAGIAVVEDAAQAHGATWRGRPVGGLGQAGCFSFYPGKTLGAFGDAGAVVTNDPALAERVRSISNHGRPPGGAHRHELIGSNDRLDALQAEVLSAKLARLDTWAADRRRVAERYRTALAGLDLALVENAAGADSCPHLVVIRSTWRDQLQQRLAAEGIASGVHYPIPCHLQPAFAGVATPSLPVVEQAADQILSLPTYPHLGDADIDRIAAALERALAPLQPDRRLAS